MQASDLRHHTQAEPILQPSYEPQGLGVTKPLQGLWVGIA